MSEQEYVQRVGTWGFSPERMARIAALTHSRIERLSDLGHLTAFLFAGRLNLPAEAFAGGKLDGDELRKAYQIAQWDFDSLRTWDIANIEAALKRVAAAVDKKFRDVVRPFYVAITGSPTSIPLFDAMEILGRDIVRERLRNALDVLGTPKAAEQKEWQKSLAVMEEPA